jgi:hypothetical protein
MARRTGPEISIRGGEYPRAGAALLSILLGAASDERSKYGESKIDFAATTVSAVPPPRPSADSKIEIAPRLEIFLPVRHQHQRSINNTSRSHLSDQARNDGINKKEKRETKSDGD